MSNTMAKNGALLSEDACQKAGGDEDEDQSHDDAADFEFEMVVDPFADG